MMESAILSGAFALAGVILGGLATHILSLRREREARNHGVRLEHRNMLRDKYERLYSLVSQWTLAISTQTVPFSAAMQGKLTYDQANDVFIKSMEGKGGEFEKIELLIDAYIPACRASYDECLAHRSRINSAHGDFRRQYDAEGPMGSYRQIGPYTQAAIAFEKAAQMLKARIVEELRKLP